MPSFTLKHCVFLRYQALVRLNAMFHDFKSLLVVPKTNFRAKTRESKDIIVFL